MTMPPPHPDPSHGPPFQRPPGNGAIAWLVGLVLLLCLPFVGSLVASGLMIALGLAQRSKGQLATHNGVRAANWGLTYLLATIVLVGTHFGLLWFLTHDGGSVGGFFPFGLIIITWGLVSLWHLVICIWGGVVSAQNRAFSGNGLPFFRS